MSAVEADVREFVLGRLEGELREAGIAAAAVSDETDLLAEGVIDSLGVVELIAVVSDRYGIDDEWEDYEPDELLVIGPFCRYVAQRAVTDGQTGA
jgi:acyl carrier protein